jgi:hypothetical protein
MKTPILRSLLAVLALFFALAIVANAQVATSGRLSGVVTDPSGAVIPGATLTISQASTGFSQIVTSSATGVYTFPALQPGTYQLKVTAKGFTTAIYSNVVVEAAQTTNVQIKMKVGETSQTVEVSAQAEVLKTTQNALATTISPTLIENLPLAGRDLLEFATIVAGAANPENQRYTTYNNLPNAALNIEVNGTNDNFQRYKTFSTGFFTAAPLREGAFEEATVSTSNLSSDAGAEGAAKIQFITKRGTDKFHGRGFWQAQNSFFNANSYTNNAIGRPLPKSRSNYYGGDLGGPLWPHNRAFFFFHLEYNDSPSASYPRNTELTSDAANGLYTYDADPIPSSTPAWVSNCTAIGTDSSGNPYGTCQANLYALAAANGFPATPDPTVAGVLSTIASYNSKGTLEPLATTPTSLYNINQQYLDQLVWSRPSDYKQWWPTTRLDVNFTPKVHWSDSWDLYWRKIANVPNWPGSPYAGNGFKSTYYTWSNNVDWTISPTLLNTTSFGIMSTVEEFNPGAISDPFKPQGERLIGGYNNLIFSVPSLVPGFILPVPRNNPQFNPTDEITWTHGNHTSNFGFYFSYSNMHELEQNDPPTYYMGLVNGDPALGMFSSANFPGISAANNNRDLSSAEQLYATLTGRLSGVFGNNYVNLATGQFPPEGALVAKEAQKLADVYFQDAWHATPHLAFNYGFKWNFSGAVHNTNNSYFVPSYRDLLGPSATLFNPGVLNGTPAPQDFVNPNPYPGDYFQPQPNLGLAWNPDISSGFLGKLFGGQKTVLRGGFALTSYDEGWETFENASIYTNPGDFNSIAYYPFIANGSFPPGSQFLSDPTLNNRVNATSFPPAFQSSLPMSDFTFTGQSFGAVDPNIKTPYVEQWNFGIQRQVPGSTVVEINYVGNHAVHMWQFFNLNEINIFGQISGDSFLQEFKNAQINLTANGGTTFADNTGAPGIVPTPLFDTAFTGNGITTGAADSGGYANPGFIFDLQTGQAGSMAYTFAGSPAYLCNTIGANFSPCGNVGGTYPINLFEANPYIAGATAGILSDPGSSTYNALQISARHPVGYGLTLGANYTFSKSLGSRYLSYFTDTAQENYITLRDMALNKGPSDNDMRHIFNVYWSYDLPTGKGKQFDMNNTILNRIVGGWNFGGIVTYHTGIPFWLQGGVSTFNDEDGGVVLSGLSYSQIQKNIGVYKTSNPFLPVDWLNPNFSTSGIQPTSTPGVIGNLLFFHGPSFFNTDLALTKNIPIYKVLDHEVNLTIKANFINAFNHPNWSVGSYGAPGYIAYANSSLAPPSAILANSPRAIQFLTQLQF